jgi:hypothetical protein
MYCKLNGQNSAKCQSTSFTGLTSATKFLEPNDNLIYSNPVHDPILAYNLSGGFINYLQQKPMCFCCNDNISTDKTVPHNSTAHTPSTSHVNTTNDSPTSSNKNSYWTDKKWGKSMWEMLHSISFSYPDNPTDEEKTSAKNFILSLIDLIPCSKCCKNYENNLKTMKFSVDFAVQNKNNFILWAHELHNCVNEELGKEKVNITDLYEKYKKDVNNTSSEDYVCSKNC